MHKTNGYCTLANHWFIAALITRRVYATIQTTVDGNNIASVSAGTLARKGAPDRVVCHILVDTPLPPNYKVESEPS